jgi:hypothetical protein
MTLALDRPTDGRSRPIDRSIETDRPIDRSRPTDRSTDSIDARDVKRNQLDRCTSIDRPILRRSSTSIDRLSSIAIDFHRSTFIDRDRDRSRRARARGRAGACMIEDARRVSTRETPTRGVDGNRASSVERGVERGVAIGRRARPRRRASVERVSSRRCGGRVWSSLVEFGSFERRGGRRRGASEGKRACARTKEERNAFERRRSGGSSDERECGTTGRRHGVGGWVGVHAGASRDASDARGFFLTFRDAIGD